MIITQSTCTGCGACSEICPVCCIDMKENRTGRVVPCINENKCIQCGLCRKNCPQNNAPIQRYPITCYAAWSKHKEDYIYSASGGVAAAFARYQLANNNVIYGCDYDTNADLRHFRVCNEADVHRMQSSKYSQSKACDCFGEIKELLEKDISVVFVGTPCQVAGLLKALKKNYRSLITIDLICHGAPPNIYLKQHLKELNLVAPYQKIRFRGEFDQNLTVWKEDKVVYQKDKTEDEYFIAFYQNMISYDACFSCQYAQSKRVSDITIGDFWGLGELKEIDYMSKRPSIILVNSERGQKYFEKAKCNLIYEKREVEEGICGNGRLMNPPGENYKARIFKGLNRINFIGFRNSVKFVVWISKRVQFIRSISIRLNEWTSVVIRKIFSIVKGRTK